MNTAPTPRKNGAAGAALPSPEERLPLLWLHDPFRVEKQHYLIDELIEPQSLIVMYGEPNCGKSTVGVDFGMHIAQGTPWRDRDTTKGLVLHIAGEGVRGIRMRQAAWILSHDAPRTLPYAVIPRAVDIGSAASIRAMVATVLEAAAGMGESPRLVTVDTLARCMFGDENTSLDMGRFIAGCDAIRTETGAAVLVLHHAGKDLAKGARGHSSLRAAADTELLIEGQANPRTLSVKKQRDLELGEPMGFRLEPVAIGQHPDKGTDITSVVMAHDEAAPIRKAKATGKHQQAALKALREYVGQNPADSISSDAIRGLFRGKDIPRQRQPDVLNYLVNARVLTASIGGYTLDRQMLP